MASAQGTATLSFGAFPGSNEASVAVTGQATISATSKAEAFMMGDDSTSDHPAADVRYLAAFIGFTCGTPTAATGFTIYARSEHQLQGDVPVRWVWAD
jgi:hypothetical protein